MLSRDDPPTRIEREVLRAIIDHGNVPRAAGFLDKAESTVNTHLDRMRSRYHIESTVTLVAHALTNGWLERDS